MNYLIVFPAVLLLAVIPTSLYADPIVQVVDYKSSFNLTCDHAPEGTPVTWTFGTAASPPTAVPGKETKVYSEVDHTLTVVKAEPAYIGLYTCTYDTDKTQQFSIEVSPYVIQSEKPRNIIQGDPMGLDCRAWAVPEPTIKWEHNGVDITTEMEKSAGRISLKNSTASASGPKFPILENGTLRIEKMDYPDAGNYTCYATSIGLDRVARTANATTLVQVKDKYAALWPFLGICVEVAILCAIILIYEKRRAKRIEEEERQEEAAHLNANNDTKPPLTDDVRQRK